MNRAGVFVAFVASAWCTLTLTAGDVVFENRRMTFRIGEDACAKSLVLKGTGEECLSASA